MVETLYLVKNGVPWDVAISLPADERAAFTIVFGQFEGGKFNWAAGEWEKSA